MENDRLEYEKAIIREQAYQKELERLQEQLQQVTENLQRKHNRETER